MMGYALDRAGEVCGGQRFDIVFVYREAWLIGPIRLK